jgi:peptide/nickel transport system ATP-binding protein
MPRCRERYPDLNRLADGRQVSCYKVEQEEA